MPHDPLTDFDVFDHEFLGASHRVYRLGDGPPVLVMAEMPGITPSVADFARRVASRGMTVYMPHLYGVDGAEPSPSYVARSLALGCINKEFAALRRGTTAPATLWLRDLMRRACGWTGYKGAGAVGMCFTGGFALAMMMEPEMIAPVLAQPSLPIGLTKRHRADLHMDSGDLKDARLRAEADDVQILGLRFTDDPLCRRERFDAISEVFGDRFLRVEIDSSEGNEHGIRRLAHSVLTEDFVDTDDHPTNDAMDVVLAFLAERLLAPSNRAPDIGPDLS